MAKQDDLLEYYTKARPFGPIESPATTNRNVLDSLFYRDTLIYDGMRHHPSLIIGRRGSGKTAFLTSIHLDPRYKLIVDLSMPDAFTDIVQRVQEAVAKGPIVVENVSTLWNMTFWHAVFVQLAEMKRESDELDTVRRYVSGIGLKRIKNAYNAMRTVIKVLRDRGGDGTVGAIANFVGQWTFDGVVFANARDAAINFMAHNNVRGILLLDSLDDFPLDDKTTVHALTGLLKCEGSFYFPASPCQLTCCIPAELYHQLLLLSSNPSKDFQSKIFLHWHASELICLAAKRYLNFLKLHYPQIYSEFSHIDTSKRSQAGALWHSVFPHSIEDTKGLIEDPVAYILRHTQLLPRQLLIYLNAIGSQSLAESGNPTQFNGKTVLAAVHENADAICHDIFSGFKRVHPGAPDACKRCIPLLPLRFTDGKLHQVYNWKGKNVEGIHEYEDFKDMMKEIGAIGRVVTETERYIIGRFEYTEPHKLVTSPYDELCLHPVFATRYNVKPEKTEKLRAVYPYGSDVDEPEYRDLI